MALSGRTRSGAAGGAVPARRARRPSLSNEAFLDKALDLFLEQGFERTSIDAITAAAGMAKRTVYLRYGDKASLFKAALARAIEEWIVPVERLRGAETEDVETSLLAIAQILVENALSPAGLRLLRLANAAAQTPQLGASSVAQGSDRTIAYLAELFRRRLDPAGDGLPDAEAAAEAFLHLVVGGPATHAAWGAAPDRATVDARVRYGVRLFLHGFLPKASSPAGEEVRRLRGLLGETLERLDRLEAKA